MSRCVRGGCPGTVHGGFCDYCGFRPPKKAGPPAPVHIGAEPPGPARPEDAPDIPPPGVASNAPDPEGRDREGPGRNDPRPGHQGPRSGPRRPPPRPPGSERTGPSTGQRRADSGRPGTYGRPLELAAVPSVPYRDPEDAVMRHVASGGGRGGRGPTVPKLRPGDLVSGQYRVHGCLAHGGLGLIYLAYDHNVGHWVILKGLLDTDAADGRTVVAAERAALAAVSHPNIVKIHNFVQHPAPTSANAPQENADSYIVMEYIGGRSLKELVDDRQRTEGRAARLPVDHVIAYGIEMLRALDYLHGRGLLYCDLKPANVMQSERRITLVDLGATRRMDRGITRRPLMGTPGFQAPEVTSEGPSISSDLYTVGRTMAVLSFPFDFTQEYADRLPPRERVPLLMAVESYDRLLRRATDRDPRRRFQDASEMIDQLYGVLREVLSEPRGRESWGMESWSGPSGLFIREPRTAGTDIVPADDAESALGSLDPAQAAAALPAVRPNGSFAPAGAAELAEPEPGEIIETLTGESTGDAASASPEATLVLLGALLGRRDDGDGERAARLLKRINRSGVLTGDWRLDWYSGLAALAAGRWGEARDFFDPLYSRLPGEAAPKLALAFCCEGMDDWGEAARRYESVLRTDAWISAAFGLARVRLRMGKRADAIRALDEVSPRSSHYAAAQLAAMAVAVRGRPPHLLTEQDLLAADGRLAESRVDGERRTRLAVEVLDAALQWVLAGRAERPGVRLLGAQLTEEGLRRKLEETYRTLARYAEDTDAKNALVMRANAVRPRTFF
jgi:serine/threonine-protein kinase PknG